MSREVFSIVFAIFVLFCLVVSFKRLHIGLMVLAILTPFYSILRESSSGSPLFFLWPYLLSGTMIMSIVSREMTSLIVEKGITKRGVILVGFSLVAIFYVVFLESAFGMISSFFLDTGLSVFPKLLVNQNLFLLVVPMLLILVAFFILYFRAMRLREGAIKLLDLVVVSFLVYGIFEAGRTYLLRGLLFAGVQGYRYYFIMGFIYFLARYSIASRKHVTHLLVGFTVAFVLANMQVVIENYLLNYIGVDPDKMPWVGHLYENFGYAPEGERTFFEGKYVPLGFMYMPHMSGLFLLLGWALWLPRLIAARTLREGLPYLTLLLFLLLSIFWTSRTVLVLLIVTYLTAGLLLRPSWLRFTIGAAALTVVLGLYSNFAIPGARYAIIKDSKFIFRRGFANLARAVAFDLRDIGEKSGLYGDGKVIRAIQGMAYTKDGWILTGGSSQFERESEIRRVGIYSAAITHVSETAELRKYYMGYERLRGRKIMVGAWVKADIPSQVVIEVHDGKGGSYSSYHPGGGGWEFISVHRIVDKYCTQLLIDLEVRKPGTAYFDGVILVDQERYRVESLMDNVPKEKAVEIYEGAFFPDGWTLHGEEARMLWDREVKRVGFCSAAVTPGAKGAFLERGIADAKRFGGKEVSVGAWVKAFGPSEARIIVDDGESRKSSHYHTGKGRWEFIKVNKKLGRYPPFLRVLLIVKGSGTVYFDGVVLKGGDREEELMPRGDRVVKFQPIITEGVTRKSYISEDDFGAALISGRSEAKSSFSHWLFGSGFSTSGWTKLFFEAELQEKTFIHSSYSDTKYLEFFEQVGIVGLFLLLMMGIVPMTVALVRLRRDKRPGAREELAGIILVLIVVFISLFHLPSMFRVGFNTVVYILMAVLAFDGLPRAGNKSPAAERALLGHVSL